ncbi:hypothetical protein ES692_14880 [Psychroserpens burtonensis]|uniref:LPS export ABC transporter periplasmic protein LptC n=1 Tax=Psychroserpens burtonensis TaxID=49278 RepID=A0A5C7BB80_9FLAO|nr:hypothetical protein [Psychroserpens burtonensis]TXE15902.1 hypothetical protein ES692_14880 [Psychroserpens burtonensis]
MKRILITVCLFACFFSCSNDDMTTPEAQDSNFYALTVGNSWVYKNYRYDQNSETYEDTGVIDSVSIISKEDIEGNTYFKFRRLTTGNEDQITFCNPNGEHFENLREWEGNLVWSDGTVKFTNTDYSLRTLNENDWGNIVEQLLENTTILNVEAEDFACVNSERYVILPDGEQAPGLDRFYYADGIGLIYDSTSFVSSGIPVIVRRLDSYDIQ